MFKIKSSRPSSQTLTCSTFLALFSRKLRFHQKSNPSEKMLYLRKNQIADDTGNIDDTGNLEDLPRLMFIDEECGNLLVVNDSGELSGNIT